MTQEYIGTKIVTAWPADKDGEPGYGVKYQDGYTSWSPKDVFEESYLAIGHVSDKPLFLQRLIGERAQLASNTAKIKQFMKSSAFMELSVDHRVLLRTQKEWMEHYLDTLARRVELLLSEQEKLSAV